MAGRQDIFEGLPTSAAAYIRRVIWRVSMGKRINREVAEELAGHFTYALRDCTDDKERETIAQAVISQFGDARQRGKFIRVYRTNLNSIIANSAEDIFSGLPYCAVDYILWVIWRVSMGRRINREVAAELAGHFTHALRDCVNDSERETLAKAVISQFGDPKLLGKLIRRGKKRCRPLWKKAIIRSFQATGIAILACLVFSVAVNLVMPTPNTRYLTVMAQHARPDPDLSDNALHDYIKAARLYQEAPDELARLATVDRWNGFGRTPEKLTDLSKADRNTLNAWLAENEQAWEVFVAAGRKKRFWMEFQPPEPDSRWLDTMFGDDLGAIGQLAMVGLWRSRQFAEAGDANQAIADALAVVRSGRHLYGSGGPEWYHSQALAMIRRADKQLCRLVESGSLSADQMQSLQAELTRIMPDSLPPIDSEYCRLRALNLIDFSYTQGGPGGGHFVPAIYLKYVKRWYEDKEFYSWALTAVAHAGRDKAVSLVNDFYALQSERLKLSPYQRYAQSLIDWEDEYIQSVSRARFPLKGMLVGFGSAGYKPFDVQACHEATLTILALHRYRLAKGEYPATLDQLLAEGYLTALPDDPYAEDPLTYARRGDDFILYSVSGDFEDNGGKPNEDNSWFEDADSSTDHIFWPVQE